MQTLNIPREEFAEGIRPNYIRVSQILSPLANLAGIDSDVLSIAAANGTAVHEAIRNDAEGLYSPLPCDCRGRFASYLKWKAVTRYEVYKSELRLYDEKYRITGCLDAIVSANGTDMYLVDWKNTAAQNRPYWELQGAFYHHLAAINGIKLRPKIMFVQLCKSGGLPNVFSFEMSEVLWNQCLKHYFIYLSQNPLSINTH